MRTVVLIAAIGVLACDESRVIPPGTMVNRDAGPSANADAGPGADAGPTSDGGAIVPAPEVDPRCVDGMYTETLPDPNASITTQIAGYTPANVVPFIQSVLDARYPTGAYLVRGALMDVSRGNCAEIFLNDRSNAGAVLRSLSTVVHECGHFFDLAMNGRYHVTAATQFTCTNGDTVARRGRTFARSLLNADAYSARRPPCGMGGGRNCDSYADIYLDGDPDDAMFDSGDQGFNSLLEETVQYVNSLATGYAYADQLGAGSSISERDGILTFLWYVGRYLRLARLEHPDAYTLLSTDRCWRDAILTTWGRAWLMLGATANARNLGINDAAIIALVRDPEILGEIQRLRVAAGCP